MEAYNQWRRVTIFAGGGGGLRDTKPYFTDRNSFVALIFCYKFNSTDKFSESWGVYIPTPSTRYGPVFLSEVQLKVFLSQRRCDEIEPGGGGAKNNV